MKAIYSATRSPRLVAHFVQVSVVPIKHASGDEKKETLAKLSFKCHTSSENRCRTAHRLLLMPKSINIQIRNIILSH